MITNFSLTNKGNEYVARALTGKKLVFTRGEFGDGVPESAENPLDFTELINPLGPLIIAGKSSLSNRTIIQTMFSNRVNGALLDTFYLTEVGIFGRLEDEAGSIDENGAETLLLYGYIAQNRSDCINSGMITEFEINWPLEISNAASINITIDDSLAYPSKEEYNNTAFHRASTTGTGSAINALVEGVVRRDGLCIVVKLPENIEDGATLLYNNEGEYLPILNIDGSPVKKGAVAGSYITVIYSEEDQCWYLIGGGGGGGIEVPVPIAQGGTGGTTAGEARTNLGAVSKSGDTMTGPLKIKVFDGSATRIANTGDGAAFITQEDVTNDSSDRRLIKVTRKNALKDAVQLSSVEDGVQKWYNLYGQHNEPTPLYTHQTQELTNEDLNNVKTVGFYFAAGSNTCTNIATTEGEPFGLEVKRTAGNYLTQIMSMREREYIRYFYSTGWSTWKDYMYESDVERARQLALDVSSGDYVDWVIPLIKLTSDTVNNYATGDIFLKRINTAGARMTRISVTCGKKYGETIPYYTLSYDRVPSGNGVAIFPRTFTYNNEKWFGIYGKITSAAFNGTLYFVGRSNRADDITMIAVYNNNTATVLNAEIYNSLANEGTSLPRVFTGAPCVVDEEGKINNTVTSAIPMHFSINETGGLRITYDDGN